MEKKQIDRAPNTVHQEAERRKPTTAKKSLFITKRDFKP